MFHKMKRMRRKLFFTVTVVFFIAVAGLNGQPEQEVRWKRVIGALVLGILLGALAPAWAPAVIFRPSMKRMTRSARLRPFACHDGRRRFVAPAFAGFAPGPLKPMTKAPKSKLTFSRGPHVGPERSNAHE